MVRPNLHLHARWRTLAVAASLAFAVPTFAVAQSSSVDGAARMAIDGQIAAFRADDGERAFSYAAPGVRRMFGTSARFMSMVRQGYQPVYAPRDYSFGRTAERNGTIYQEVLVTGPKGKAWTALYTLVRQGDGSMLITGCQIAESEAFAI